MDYVPTGNEVPLTNKEQLVGCLLLPLGALHDELRVEIEQAKRELYKMAVTYGGVETLPAMIERASNELAQRTLSLNELRAEVERLRARLYAAERVIEVVRAREIGTAGGVGAAFAAYDEVLRFIGGTLVLLLVCCGVGMARDVHRSHGGWPGSRG